MGFTPEQASRAKAVRGKGCPKCKDTGYKGRMGIYEVLNVTKAVKEAILRKATTPELKEIASKEGFRQMSDMGREMILSGDLNFRDDYTDTVSSIQELPKNINKVLKLYPRNSIELEQIRNKVLTFSSNSDEKAATTIDALISNHKKIIF